MPTLMQYRNQVLGMAAQNPQLAFVRPNSLDDTPQLHIDIDQAKANAQGVALANVNSTLSAAWGSGYINDFIDRGRVEARLYAGRCALSHVAGRPEPLVCAHCDGRHDALLVLRHLALDHGPLVADPLQRLPGHRTVGRRQAGRVVGHRARRRCTSIFQQAAQDDRL